MMGILLVFPLVLEQGRKGQEIYNSGIVETGEPLPYFSSKALSKYSHLDIIMVYLFEIRPV